MALYLFLGLVAVIAIFFGAAAKRDGFAASRRDPLDPDTIWADIVGEEELTEEERGWLDELAALELPRRHRIC